MYLLLGDSRMESSDYKGAIHSFERAQSQMRHFAGSRILTISLVSSLPTIWQPVNNGRDL